MRSPTRKKWFAVCKATVLGALFVVAAMWVFNVVGAHWHGQQGEFWTDTMVGIAFLISMPAVHLGLMLGMGPPFLNPYAINGILGAICSGVIACLWHFSIKPVSKPDTE